MIKNEIIARNPLINLGYGNEYILNDGGLGAVLAHAGVGKTALLVQVALHAMTHEQPVLHVSLNDAVSKVDIWYRELFHDIAGKYDSADMRGFWERTLVYRFIMTFKVEGFSAPRLEERLTDLMQQNIFKPHTVIIDGLILLIPSLIFYFVVGDVAGALSAQAATAPHAITSADLVTHGRMTKNPPTPAMCPWNDARMADTRAIRVFVSSTFRDMQAERDELVKRIFPQLRRLCEERGVAWSEVDLRWGVTDEQAAEGAVLPICLAEIERTRPYFIGLLGQRYGWGGMFNTRDCSAFIMDIYRSMGVLVPRNSGEQGKLAIGIMHEFTKEMTLDERKVVFDRLPAGTPIYMAGHAMLYLGRYNDDYYIIHDFAGFRIPDADGNLVRSTARCVFVTPLLVTYLSDGRKYMEGIYSAREFVLPDADGKN